MIRRNLFQKLPLSLVALLALAGCGSQTGKIQEAPEQHAEYVGGHGQVGGAAGPNAPGAATAK